MWKLRATEALPIILATASHLAAGIAECAYPFYHYRFKMLSGLKDLLQVALIAFIPFLGGALIIMSGVVAFSAVPIVVEIALIAALVYRKLRKRETSEAEDCKRFLDPQEQDEAIQYMLDAKRRKDDLREKPQG
jgi:hypothetical protein